MERKAADDHVELRVGEGQARRVALNEDDVALARVGRSAGAGLEHLGGEVDDHAESGRAREMSRELAGAARDVEYEVAGAHQHVRADPVEDVGRAEDRTGALERSSLASELPSCHLSMRVGAAHAGSLARAGRVALSRAATAG